MSTLLSCIAAFWLTVLTLFVSAATPSPWNGLTFIVPIIIVLAIVSSTNTAIRFAVFCSVFQTICFPSQSPLITGVLITVALGSGALYRAMFSIPSTGALLATTLTGSLIYETGAMLLNSRVYYDLGYPDMGSLIMPAALRMMVSMATVLIAGSLYRNVVVRFRQAFVNIRTGV